MFNACISRIIMPALIVCAVMLLAGCGGSSVQKNMTAEERFNEGMKKFQDHSYLDAQNDFEIIRLQFAGSALADKAQFYLGECHFEQDEFLLAAEEYQALKRSMPASPLVPLAQYKIGLCYYRLSPQSSLDQVYTSRAIEEFQTFIEYYPKDEHVADAEAKITELNGRLAKKLYDAAELYMKMDYFKAALIYYDAVIEKYHDTPYAEPALIGKIRALVSRKKYTEAKPEIDRYLEKYPQSKRRDEVEGLRREVDGHLQSRSMLDSVSPTEGRLFTATDRQCG